MQIQMFALCGALAVVPTSNAGLVDMVGELTGINAIAAVPGQPDYPDTITLRIYAVLTSGGDTLDTIYGTSDHPILVSASSMFYQNVFGGPTSADIDTDQFSVFPDLAYDSWITIGASSMVDNALSIAGTSFSAFARRQPALCARRRLVGTRGCRARATCFRRRSMAGAGRSVLTLRYA
jgi:hypothetical protein